MKTIAEEAGLPVYQPESINTPEGAEMLRSLKPDLCVVAAYGQILKDFILAIPPQGFVNVHASLLPKYRGAAPINWAIYHGETTTGVTIFKLSTGVDTGDMLLWESIEIGPTETAGDVEARLAPIGAKLALQAVDQVAAGTAKGVKQDASLASRAPKLKKEDGLLDWSRTAARVCCQVRAMHPWPTAYTFWHRPGQEAVRLIVHQARVRPEGTTELPGSILNTQDVLSVAAGGGTVVEVMELQPAGKRRMLAAEFLRGRRPQAGDRVGAEGERGA
jgi:methionyl-tRNA formyltransferase